MWYFISWETIVNRTQKQYMFCLRAVADLCPLWAQRMIQIRSSIASYLLVENMLAGVGFICFSPSDQLLHLFVFFFTKKNSGPSRVLSPATRGGQANVRHTVNPKCHSYCLLQAPRFTTYLSHDRLCKSNRSEASNSLVGTIMDIFIFKIKKGMDLAYLLTSTLLSLLRFYPNYTSS